MQPLTDSHQPRLISRIEELLERTREFKKTPDFFNRLVFIKQSSYLAPYNAFLVRQQRPEARLVLTSWKWLEKFGRTPLPKAHPIVILKAFGPVEFVYDIQDTQGPEIKEYDPNLPVEESCRRIFPWDGYLYPELDVLYKRLLYNCEKAKLAVRYEPLPPGLAGYVNRYPKKPVKGEIGKPGVLEEYVITLNLNQPPEVQLPALVHELAHIFCGHLSDSESGRSGVRIQEFEAEAVAYLYCYRNGFRPRSEEYLAGYLEDGSEPELSRFDTILRAHKSIESLERADEKEDGFRPLGLDVWYSDDQGHFCEMHLSGGRLTYEGCLFADKEAVQQTRIPAGGAWRTFLKGCNRAGIWGWNGTRQGWSSRKARWKISITLPYRKLEMEEVEEVPEKFDVLLRAVSRLGRGKSVESGRAEIVR